LISVETGQISISTTGFCDICDITSKVEQWLISGKWEEGQVTIFVPGATAGLTTIENEPGLNQDLKLFFERIIPENAKYFHHDTWDDGNGFSHIRASLLKAFMTVPFCHNRLLLGTWQQIILVDFDNRSRKRELILQAIGRKASLDKKPE